MAEKKLRTLTIRTIDDDERDAIRYVMRESGYGRAAQAMIFACKAYRERGKRNKSFVEEIRDKNRDMQRRQQQTINALMDENRRLREALQSLKEGITKLSDLSSNI